MRKRSTGSVVHIKEEKYRISLLAIWSNLNEIKGVNVLWKIKLVNPQYKDQYRMDPQTYSYSP